MLLDHGGRVFSMNTQLLGADCDDIELAKDIFKQVGDYISCPGYIRLGAGFEDYSNSIYAFEGFLKSEGGIEALLETELMRIPDNPEKEIIWQ